jgi:hypothetical protein
MPLGKKDFESIENYLKENLPRLLAEQSLAKPPLVYEIELRERMVRVEEELKNQRELMKQGFEFMEKRFEAIDKRFAAVDKRFDDLIHYTDRRFSALTWFIGIGFIIINVVMVILKVM